MRCLTFSDPATSHFRSAASSEPDKSCTGAAIGPAIGAAIGAAIGTAIYIEIYATRPATTATTTATKCSAATIWLIIQF